MTPLDINGMTLGLSCKLECRQCKDNQVTFDNSQLNNLRSCLWGFFVEYSFSTVHSFFQRGRNLSAIYGSSRHVIPLENLQLVPFLLGGVRLVVASDPIGAVHINSLVLVGQTIS